MKELRNRPVRNLQLALKPLAVAVVAALAAIGDVQAVEIKTDNPDLSINWDNTVRYNVGVRTKKIGLVGNNPLYDEGEYSFDRGDVVTNRLDLLSEFDLVFQKSYGFRVSAAVWGDSAYHGKKVNRNPAIPAAAQTVGSYRGDQYSDYTKRYYAGPSGELLDAFVFATFNLGESPLSVKVGRHTEYWGESLLLLGAVHGISYSQMPIDAGKGYANPGAEAKELFRPLDNISSTLQVANNLSFSAQYFLAWDSYHYPEGGTFMGPADPAFYGPNQVQQIGIMPNGGVVTPKKRGDYGLAAHWSPEALDGTVGLYYRNITDKLLSMFSTTGQVPSATNPLGLQYQQFYGENIDLLGLSLSKNVAGVSIGAELSYRRNMVLYASPFALTPDTALRAYTAAFHSPAVAAAAVAALYPAANGTVTLKDNSYAARGNTIHMVVNAAGLISTTPVFDTASYLVEATYSRLDKITANANMYNGEGYNNCNKALLGGPFAALYKDKWDGCATKDALQLSLNFTPTWFQVLPGINLSAPLNYSRGIFGNAPVLLGGNEGSGTYSLGLSADAYQKYRFDLKYVGFFGKSKVGTLNGLPAVTSVNGLNTLLADRGALYLTFKTTF